MFEGLPLIKVSSLKKKYPATNYSAHVALSYRKFNRIREEKFLLLKGLGYHMASYNCSKSVYWDDLLIGENCLILENQTIQPGVKIGNNVMIWSGNHLGHASIIKDHVYISSHVVISGHCEIGERSFLGVNATLKDFVKLGPETFVTMSATVAQDSPGGDVILAARSALFENGSETAEKIKDKYFGLK